MAASPAQRRHGLRALRHRNFRLFLAGQFLSLVGTWMQSVALGWLLYRLTRSAALLGLAGFLTQIPALVLSGHEAIWPILALNLLLGVANAADVPARQSFLVEMVEGSEDLPSAIALNASAFNLARLVGPALAGPLIALLGEGNVFLLNGSSYLAVIAALLAIRVPPRPPRAAAAPAILAHLREGIAYVAGFAPIGAVLLLLATVSLLGAVADRIGAFWTAAVTGLLCLAAAGVFARILPALRAAARPIYARLGVLPEVAVGPAAQSTIHRAPK